MDILTAESLAGVRAEKDKVSERNETQSGTSDEDPGTGQLFRHIMLYPLYMNTLSLYLQFNVFMVLLDVAQDNGVSAQDAPKLNLIFSVVEVFAYLSVGFVTKERRGRTRNLQIICQLLCGVIPFLYGISSTFTHFAVLTAVSAYTTGTMLLLNVILMRQYLGEALFARALGVTQTTGIISYFAVSPLISYYRDVHKSYAPFLQIISILCIVFSLFWLLEIPYAINERKRSRNDEKVKHSPTATI